MDSPSYLFTLRNCVYFSFHRFVNALCLIYCICTSFLQAVEDMILYTMKKPCSFNVICLSVFRAGVCLNHLVVFVFSHAWQ